MMLPEEVLSFIRSRRARPNVSVRAPITPELERRVRELAEYLAEDSDEVVVELADAHLTQRYRITPGLTPEWLVEKARRVLGRIALDPASSAEANARVGADRYITRDEDGLGATWEGPVFLSPPGGRLGTTQVRWWKKLNAEWIRADRRWSAIFVGHSAAHWLNEWTPHAKIVRVRFEVRPGVPSAVETEAIVLCLSSDPAVVERFQEEFGQ